MASVREQTLSVHEHLIGIDYGRVGPAEMRNHLADASDAEWFLPLDDDDVLYPYHLRRLLRFHSVADVIYSWPDTDGSYDHVFHRPFEEMISIPVTALVRASTWRMLGGFRTIEEEDRDLWWRAILAGARFYCVETVTWRFRIHDRSRFSSP